MSNPKRTPDISSFRNSRTPQFPKSKTPHSQISTSQIRKMQFWNSGLHKFQNSPNPQIRTFQHSQIPPSQFLKFNIPRIPNSHIPKFQKLKFQQLQSFKVSKSRSFKVSKFHSSKVQTLRIPRFKSFKMTSQNSNYTVIKIDSGFCVGFVR